MHDPRSVARVERAALQLRHRMQALRWWSDVLAAHPMGVAPKAIVHRMLGVSRTRVNALIAEGRLTTIGPPPWGNPTDVFVPVAELLTAPSLMEQGGPLVSHTKPSGARTRIRLGRDPAGRVEPWPRRKM